MSPREFQKSHACEGGKNESFGLGLGENQKRFPDLRSLDIFCMLSVSCPEPWAISSWAHSYLRLLGTHVRNECIKLINIFYISTYYIQKGYRWKHDLLLIWLRLGVDTKIFSWLGLLGCVLSRASCYHVQDPKYPRVILCKPQATVS